MSTDSVIARTYYNSLLLPWNPNQLNDQRLGGGIAWAAGEIPLVLVMLALLVQWSRQDKRQATRFDRREDRDHNAELVSYNAMLAQMAGPSTRPVTATDSTSTAAPTASPQPPADAQSEPPERR